MLRSTKGNQRELPREATSGLWRAVVAPSDEVSKYRVDYWADVAVPVFVFGQYLFGFVMGYHPVGGGKGSVIDGDMRVASSGHIAVPVRR
jgi:hypothetical protein